VPIISDGGGGGGAPFNGGTITQPLYIDNADAANPGLKVDAGDANGEIARFRKSNGDLVGYIGSVSGSFAPGADKPTMEVSKDQFVVNLDPALGAFFAVSNKAGDTIVDVESTGSVTFEPPAGSTDSPLIIRTESGAGAFDVAANGNASAGFPFRANAGLVIFAPAAPADGDIAAGECALWFDRTNGVGNTKLMVKGKSADGTVKTASIVLA
jgi:hypothetical protein